MKISDLYSDVVSEDLKYEYKAKLKVFYRMQLHGLESSEGIESSEDLES